MRYPDQPWFLLDENSGAPSGGTPSAGGAPASAPSAPPGGGATSPPEDAGAAPSDSPAGGHDPFDGMESNDYYDSIDLGPAETGTGDEPGAVAAPPVAGEGGEPTPPVTPAPPVPQAAAAPPTAPATPAQDVTTPPRSMLDQTLDGLKGAANQTALSEWASQNLFKLSDADIEGLNTDAAGTVQKMMGRVYMHAMQSAANLIKNLVPEMVNSGITTQQSRSQRATEALNEFYQTNPHLSADQHGAAVDRWARAFRSMNPQASRADAIAFVGKAVSAEFGIWPGQNNGSAAPAARRAAPFAPARQGGRAPAGQKGPHDPYAGMEDEYD